MFFLPSLSSVVDQVLTILNLHGDGEKETVIVLQICEAISLFYLVLSDCLLMLQNSIRPRFLFLLDFRGKYLRCFVFLFPC